ncbi:MAG: hypothetical protein Q7V57_18575 [Actinomycetota bacterium]|nr:hypothetical protein [Actinomycetota bacterium]
MTAFNITAGLVTVASLIFSVVTHYRARAIDQAREFDRRLQENRLADLLAIANSAAEQSALVGVMADRDETTKKELKHLTLSLSSTLKSLQDALARSETHQRRTNTARPRTYFKWAASPESPKD